MNPKLEMFDHVWTMFMFVSTVKHGGQSMTVWNCFKGKENRRFQMSSILNYSLLKYPLLDQNFTLLCAIVTLVTRINIVHIQSQLQSNNSLKIMIPSIWETRQGRERCPTSKTDLWNVLRRERNNRTVEIFQKIEKLTARMPRMVGDRNKERWKEFLDEKEIRTSFYSLVRYLKYLCSILSMVHVLLTEKKFVRISQRLFHFLFLFISFFVRFQ